MLRYVIDRLRLGRDRLRRKVATWIWDRPTNFVGPFANRVVFVRWDAKLGDTVVLSWVLREFQRQCPELEITIIAGPEFERLFREGYGINSVYIAGRRKGWRDLSRLAKLLRKPKYVVHLGAIWRPRDLYFVHKLQAEHVVGLDDGLSIIDIKLGERTRGWHFSDKLAPWLDDLGLDTSNRDYWVPRSDQACARVDQWWPTGGEVVGLCPYGASRKRHLTNETIRQIAQLVLHNPSTRLLMLVHPSEVTGLKESCEFEAWFSRVIFKPTTDMLEVFEQAARCKAIISVDTALVHVASGLDKPLVALYAAQSPDSENMLCWYPKSKKALSLIATSDQLDSMGKFDEAQLITGIKAMLISAAI